jgi:hypothetical protein
LKIGVQILSPVTVENDWGSREEISMYVDEVSADETLLD